MNHPAGKMKQHAPNVRKNASPACADPREKLRVLLVENSVHDELSIVNELHQGGFEIDHKRVETRTDFQAQLKSKAWDVVICDYGVRDSNGLAILELFHQSCLDIPFILVSALIGEDLAVEALKAGAGDYVMKQNLSRLVPAINRELRAAQERQIRRRTASTQQYLASVVETCNDAIIGETMDGTVVTWNKGAERLYGYTSSEMVGRSGSILVQPYRPDAVDETLARVRRGESVENLVSVHIRKDASTVEVSLSISPVKDAAGRIIGVSTVARDITLWKEEENERLLLIQDLTSALAIGNQPQAMRAVN